MALLLTATFNPRHGRWPLLRKRTCRHRLYLLQTLLRRQIMANGMYPYRRRSVAGPIILIGLGVLFLLANIGVLSRARLWWWFAAYWPLLLILLGIVRLVEYMAARRTGGPTPRFGGGSVFLLILFIFIGIGATQSRRVNWAAVRDNVDINTDFSPFFGQKYDFEDQQEHEAGTAKNIQLENEHGSVKIHPQD